jgi:hypothetical protein
MPGERTITVEKATAQRPRGEPRDLHLLVIPPRALW